MSASHITFIAGKFIKLEVLPKTDWSFLILRFNTGPNTLDIPMDEEIAKQIIHKLTRALDGNQVPDQQESSGKDPVRVDGRPFSGNMPPI